MKRAFLLLKCFLISVLIFAQQVPNGDFENWTGENPDEWDSSNELVMGLVQFTTVTPETASPFEGINSAKVTTVTQNIMFVGDVTLPGVLTLGDFILDVEEETAYIEGGIEFPFRPYSLKGHFKSNPLGDQPMIGIGFSKWNETTSERDTVGFGLMYFSNNVDTWTEFEIIIEWESEETPDSCNIIIASTDLINSNVFITGSTIWVDDLYFEYPVEREIVSVEIFDPISVEYGTVFEALPLPTQIEVTLDDSSTEMLDINWSDASYPISGDVPGDYTLTGEIVLIAGILNPSNYLAEIDVTIEDEVVIADKDIVSVEIFDPISVAYGTVFEALPLPTQIEVTLDDSSTEMLYINWSDASYPINGDVPGDYTLTGEIVLIAGILNPSNYLAEIDVTILEDEVFVNSQIVTDILIYPNPASESVTFQAERIISIQIFDINGRLLINIDNVNSDSYKIDISSLSAGKYLTKLTTETGVTVSKLIIE